MASKNEAVPTDKDTIRALTEERDKARLQVHELEKELSAMRAAYNLTDAITEGKQPCHACEGTGLVPIPENIALEGESE